MCVYMFIVFKGFHSRTVASCQLKRKHAREASNSIHRIMGTGKPGSDSGRGLIYGPK